MTEVSMKAMLRRLPDAGMVLLLFALPVLCLQAVYQTGYVKSTRIVAAPRDDADDLSQ